MKTTTLLVAAGLFLAACASTHTKPTTNLAYEGEMPQRTFRFTYEANLPATGPNDKMEMWIPYPVDTTEQEIDNVKIESNQDYKVNPLERGTGKSIYLTTMGKDINVKLSFDVTRQASSGGTSATSKEIEMGLKANSMIPATGKVSQIARSQRVNQWCHAGQIVADDLKPGVKLFAFGHKIFDCGRVREDGLHPTEVDVEFQQDL